MDEFITYKSSEFIYSGVISYKDVLFIKDFADCKKGTRVKELCVDISVGGIYNKTMTPQVFRIKPMKDQ